MAFQRKDHGERPTEERKVVTALFADVVGSTELGGAVDPEIVRSVMSRFFERMRGIAEIHGGTVEKFIGDAVMVVFGAPRMHEDDPERAVRAALAMRQSLEVLQRELALPLELRIGVNTGETIATMAKADQFLVTGDAVNVAARLQQAARPGEILVGARTEQLSRPAVEYQERPPIVAKGKEKPVVVFAAVRARSEVPESVRGLGRLRAPLIGRDRERRLVHEAFTRTRETRRVEVMTLMGQAGVGKSRLVGETIADLGRPSEVRVLSGRCPPYGTGITYWPLMDVIRADCEIGQSDDREQALKKVTARVGQLFPDERSRRAIAGRLGAMLGLEDPADGLPGVSPDRVGAEIAWGVRRYLETLAAQIPTVIVIDDLQWAETAVVEALEALADQVSGVPLLLLCLARPDLLDAYPGWGAGRSNASLLTIEALDRDQTNELLGRLLGTDELPEPLRWRLLGRAAGNPLFCEEFLRSLIDEGRLVREDESWRSVEDDSTTYKYVPDTIQAVIGARLDQLIPHEKAVLQRAAVIGERFTLAQLEALVGGHGLGFAPESLVRKGLLGEDRESTDERGLRFKHLLIRDVAYESLPKSERAQLHDRFGRWFEEAIADRIHEFSEILAYHAERALAYASEVRAERDAIVPLATRSLEASRRAGDRALALYSLENAAGHYARALELREFADERTAAHLHTSRGRAFELAGKYGAALTTYDEMATWAHERGDQRDEAAALGLQAVVFATPTARHDSDRAKQLLERALAIARAIDDRALIADFQGTYIQVAIWKGRPADGLAAAEEALKIARDLKLQARQAFTLNALGRVYRDQGQLIRAAESLREALELFSTLNDRAMSADTLCALSMVHLYVGDPAESLRASGEAQRISEEIGNRWGQSYAMQCGAIALVEVGEFGTAIETGEQAIRLAEEVGFMGIQVGPQADLGALYASLGALDKAHERIERAHAVARLRLPDWLFWSIAQRARLYMRRGELDLASQSLGEALAALGDREPELWGPYVTRLAQIELSLAWGNVDAAVAQARAAAERNRARGILMFLADFEWLEGEALRLGGRREEAAVALERARATAIRTGTKRILWRILASLAQVRDAQGTRDAAAALHAEAIAIVEEIRRSLVPVGLATSFTETAEVRALRTALTSAAAR